MMYRTSLIVAAVLAALSMSDAIGQTAFEVGAYNSPKGFGLTATYPSTGGHFNSFSVSCSLYGVLLDKSGELGARANFTHGKMLGSADFGGMRIGPYVGAGVSAGWLRDYERGYYNAFYRILNHNLGAMLALSGTGGIRIDTGSPLSLSLQFTTEIGMHLRKKEDNGSMTLSIYENGLFLAPYPELSLMYSLEPGRRFPSRTRGMHSRYVFGVEWGYTATMLKYVSYRFRDGGETIQESSFDTSYTTNANVLIDFGLRLGTRSTASIGTGYLGIQGHQYVPVELKFCLYPSGIDAGGIKMFAEGGAGFDLFLTRSLAWLGRAGFGYRIPLGGGMKLDTAISLQSAFCHPGVSGVDPKDISLDIAVISGLNLTLGLNF